MLSALFNTLIYNPLYNGLIFILGALPGSDVGIAVILLTLVVKLILFPLSRTAVRTQVKLKALTPELERIKESHKKNPPAQAQETMALYRKHGINPFSGFLLILVQLPVIFALYFVFLRGGLPDVHLDILYPFVQVPEAVKMSFLGFLDVAEKSVALALLTGITQYFQVHFAMPKDAPRKGAPEGSLSESFAKSMQLQMRYVMPVIIAIIAYTLPALIALYWTTSNVFTILQEIFVRRTAAREHAPPNASS